MDGSILENKMPKLKLTPAFHRAFETAHQIFIWLVLVYAAILITVGFSIHAQSIGDIDHRITVLESQNLEHRLTVMETILADMKNNTTMVQLNMGGTGLLIAEAVYRAIRRYMGTETAVEKEK